MASKSGLKSYLTVFAPAAILIALVWAGLVAVKHNLSSHPTGAPGSQFELKEGATLPPLELVRFQPRDVLKLQEMPHKLVLLNFWASWCEACITEMPSINRLRAKFQSQGFEVFGINVDENPEAVVPKLVRRLKMEFPVFVDEGQRLSQLFDIHAIPLSVIVDRKGLVRYVHYGDREWDAPEVTRKVQEWLR